LKAFFLGQTVYTFIFISSEVTRRPLVSVVLRTKKIPIFNMRCTFVISFSVAMLATFVFAQSGGGMGGDGMGNGTAPALTAAQQSAKDAFVGSVTTKPCFEAKAARSNPRKQA